MASFDKKEKKSELVVYTLCGNASWFSYYGKQYRDSSKNQRDLPNDLAVPFLGIHQKEMKTGF